MEQRTLTTEYLDGYPSPVSLGRRRKSIANIALTTQECTALQQLVQSTCSPRVLKRAQALLWLEAGEPLTAVARRLLLRRQTIYDWIAMYQQRADQLLTVRLANRQRSRLGQGRIWMAARNLVQVVIDSSLAATAMMSRSGLHPSFRITCVSPGILAWTR